MPSPPDSKLAAVVRRTLAMYQLDETGRDPNSAAHFNNWNWDSGIAHYGLYKTYPQLDPALQQQYFKFFAAWFDRYLDLKPPTPTINSAILLNVLSLAVHDPNGPLEVSRRERYRAYCLERVAFYRQHAITLSSGVFAHTVAGGNPDSKKQVWADNLFMLVLLLARVAVTEGNQVLFGQMVEQLELHYRHLADPATGLLYHGWQASDDDPAGSHLNGALWGRGNGWAALGAVELLELATGPAFSGFQPGIHQVILPHFEALRRFQRSDGRWHTLLDQPDSYPETSATAAISAAFLKGVRLGGLPPEFIAPGRKGLAALRASITGKGEVLGVSGSTPLLPSLADYNNVPHDQINTWGQALALLALLEG